MHRSASDNQPISTHLSGGSGGLNSFQLDPSLGVAFKQACTGVNYGVEQSNGEEASGEQAIEVENASFEWDEYKVRGAVARGVLKFQKIFKSP